MHMSKGYLQPLVQFVLLVVFAALYLACGQYRLHVLHSALKCFISLIDFKDPFSVTCIARDRGYLSLYPPI